MNKFNGRLGLLVIIGLIFLLPDNSALAFQERAREATLIDFQGKVKIKREGKEGWEKTVKNLSLSVGDTVMTQERSWARVSLADGSTIILSANSQFYLNSKIEEEGWVHSLVLVWGRLRARVSPNNPATAVSVETATAVAAVYGTSFSIGVALDGTTRIGVESGEVKVEEADGSLTLKENQEISLEPGEDSRPEEELAKVVPQEYKHRSDEDWEAWQKQIEDRFFQNPAVASGRMARRLERALKRERELLQQIDDATNRLDLLMEEARKARKRRDLETLARKRAEIKTSAQTLRKSLFIMRRLNNKLTTVFESAQELGRRAMEERKRLGDQLAEVRGNFRRIRESAHKVRLAQQEARRLLRERLPKLYQQRKELMEEK